MSRAATDLNGCRKRGPYLPLGDTDWVCLTHNVELIRVTGTWGTPPTRNQMICPTGEAHLL